LSSQGNNSYAIFDRKNKYLGSFSIISNNSIDGTNDTDGIDVCNMSFGNKYQNGLFIAQDGNNTNGDSVLNQNFKLVDFKTISDSLNLSLDCKFDFR